MLSRFSLCGNANLSRCWVKFQPISAITTSAASESTPAKKEGASPQGTGHPPEYPPATSKRDYVNFPRLMKRDRAPPVRFGFIPDSWFQFLYPKTGYTGPYMLIFGGLTYIYSKEIFPYDHNAAHLYSLIVLIVFIHHKFGDQIGAVYNKMLQEEEDMYDNAQGEQKTNCLEAIKHLKTVENLRGDIVEILKGRTESIYLQMEMHYRQRLEEAYKLVKNKLDCQAELESAERRVKQRNLLDYVTRNVMKSITPELENNALQMCINNLNALSAKA